MKGITDMKLENYEVHLPSYSIGSTIYNKIGPVCESYGRTVLVIGGEKALAAAYEKIAAAVAETRLAIMGTLLLSRGVSLCHTGNLTTNLEPISALDMTCMVPPWASTIHLAMDSPRPEPPVSLLRASSER